VLSPDEFRRALAASIAEILPAGFSAVSVEEGVWLETPDGLGTLGWAGHMDRDPTNLVLFRDAALIALSSIQDGVSMTTRDCWPRLRTTSKREMALPGARLDGTVLHMWYGSEEAPTVLLPPIELGSTSE
jgi:hypothetical protein